MSVGTFPSISPPPPPPGWFQWHGGYAYSCAYVVHLGGPLHEPTPQELAAMEAQAAEAARRREEVRGAEQRADALLAERLGERAKLFQRTGALMEASRLWPEVQYRIARGQKVQVVRAGRVETELCVISSAGEPEADRIMSILDLIATDERKLWEMANVFPRYAAADDPTPTPRVRPRRRGWFQR